MLFDQYIFRTSTDNPIINKIHLYNQYLILGRNKTAHLCINSQLYLKVT